MIEASRKIALAMTGASGTPFAHSLLKRLIADTCVEQVMLLSSQNGRRCLLDETGMTVEGLASASEKIRLLDENDMRVGLASGSSLHGGMAVVPCSAGTLGRIASGTSDNLIARAADVCLKERRPLVLCIRETPVNSIHIENMRKAHDAGAVVMPLSPTFYHKPKSIEDLCEAFATRILDQLGLFRDDGRRFGG
jgi:4-hydroxy-3-polyprenylbenzoate decarboxylase